MRGGIHKGLCLLALLFVANRAEDTISSEDLNPGSPRLAEEESKSAAPSQSLAYPDLDSSEIDDGGDASEGSKSAASALAYSSGGGQSSAQANAQSGGWDNNFLRPGLSSPGLGNSAQAEAHAVANSGTSNGYVPGPYGPGNSYPLSPGLGSSSAQAKADAQTLTNGGGGYYPGGNYLKSPSSSSQAHADATALSNSGYSPVSNLYQPGYQPQQYQPSYQGGTASNTLAQSHAQADASSQLSSGPIGTGYPMYQNPQQTYGGSSANALASAQSISSASAEAHAHSDAYSRPIPRHEYIMPHSIPGAVEVIQCNKVGELHYYWSASYECLVCVCISEYGQFRPVCAKCDGCNAPHPSPVPDPVPQPVPYPVTIAPVPQPLPAPQVTCSPLPSGQTFQNPLNPCQICMCRETFTIQGEPDVQIDCQLNHECVIPPEVTTLPPDVPVPVPMPICDKFPPNVVFPHPSDVCKVCKCTYETIGLGPLEPHIVCMTLPDCVPPPLPTPLPIPIPLEPIPRPPATTPATILGPFPIPGPLPGPSPHESCRPYPPNQPFQHPWDECQECVCSEAFSYGRITIEVNCFTKKSCCFEGAPEPITISPGPYLPSPSVVNQQIPIKGLGYNLGGTGSSAEAQASAITQAGSLSGAYNPLSNGQPSGSQSIASAEANALAQSSLQSGSQPWLQPGHQHLQPNVPNEYQQPHLQGQVGQYYPLPGLDVGQPGGNQASAHAEAQAQTQSNQYQLQDQGPSAFSPKYQIPNSQGSPSPYWMGNSNAVAEAEASANAMQGYIQPAQYLGNQGGNKQVPYYNGNQGGFGSQLGGAGGNNLQMGGSGFGQYGGGGLSSGSSALAEADAVANALSGGNYGSPYFGGDLGQGSSASADAVANAQSLSSGGGGASLYPGGSLPSFYQSPYNQGYQTGGASANAQALASGGFGGQTKALALANSLRKNNKSGKSAQDDIESEEGNPVQ